MSANKGPRSSNSVRNFSYFDSLRLRLLSLMLRSSVQGVLTRIQPPIHFSTGLALLLESTSLSSMLGRSPLIRRSELQRAFPGQRRVRSVVIVGFQQSKRGRLLKEAWFPSFKIRESLKGFINTSCLLGHPDGFFSTLTPSRK